MITAMCTAPSPVHSPSDHSFLKYYSETWRVTGEAQVQSLGLRPESFDSEHALYGEQDSSSEPFIKLHENSSLSFFCLLVCLFFWFF